MVKDEKVDRIISIAPYAHPNGTQMHRFGALSNFEGVYLAPTCGYPSMRLGIHPTPAAPAPRLAARERFRGGKDFVAVYT